MGHKEYEETWFTCLILGLFEMVLISFKINSCGLWNVVQCMFFQCICCWSTVILWISLMYSDNGS